MGKEKDNDCVGCEWCVHCGRGDYTVYYCDHCEEVIDENQDLYKWEGEEWCLDCIKNALPQMACDDMDSERCGKCGNEAEMLYKFNGRWLCEDCLKDELSFQLVEKEKDDERYY